MAAVSSAPPPAPPDRWTHLLGRPPAPSSPTIAAVAGRCILVTGAGGFIASEMVRLFAASGAARILLLEIAEHALYTLDAEMAALGHGARCIPIIGSISDSTLLHALFEEHRPDLILHAAALKHAPLMERNPLAAVETNALGTALLARCAAQYGTRHLILVSTDKAVSPHSIMGASKRIAELVILAHPGRAAAVRLVNVIGSPGSVAPLFAEQIARGGPVTVTHPDARRFFLTLAQVVDLLAQSIAAEAHGILVPDPGPSIRIQDLARRMIAASGDPNVRIVFTAPRPGDKLDEVLLSSGECPAGLASPGLHRILSPAAVDHDGALRGLAAAVADRDLPALLRSVRSLVPDFQPSALLRLALPHPALP